MFKSTVLLNLAFTYSVSTIIYIFNFIFNYFYSYSFIFICVLILFYYLLYVYKLFSSLYLPYYYDVFYFFLNIDLKSNINHHFLALPVLCVSTASK